MPCSFRNVRTALKRDFASQNVFVCRPESFDDFLAGVFSVSIVPILSGFWFLFSVVNSSVADSAIIFPIHFRVIYKRVVADGQPKNESSCFVYAMPITSGFGHTESF